MRSNLMAFKNKTTPQQGTKNMKENTSFFGSKMMKLENTISIDDSSIVYYDLPYKNENGDFMINVGYQALIKTNEETENIVDLVKTKAKFHSIGPSIQSDLDYKFNTKWDIEIDLESILIEYIYANIKKYRTFALIKNNDLYNGNINKSMHNYISSNLIERYKFENIDLYVKYNDIVSDENEINTQLQYNPNFNKFVKADENIVHNINTLKKDLSSKMGSIIVNYTQTKPSDEFNFEYYFDLTFKLI